MDKTVLQTIGVVLGILLSLPVIYAVIQFTRFLTEVKYLARTTAQKLDKSIEELTDMVRAHDAALVQQGKAIAVLETRWDGRERRGQEIKNAD